MFCPQCGAQSEQQIKFCRSCGLKLSDHAQLLPRTHQTEAKQMSPEEAEHEVRWLKSTKALAVSSLLLPLSLALAVVAFLMAISPGPRDKMIPIAAIIALVSFVHFCLGGLGFVNLVRSGFFKTFKKRLIRAEAILLDQPNSESIESLGRHPETSKISSHIAAVSITEHTTHQLQPSASDSGKII